MSISPYTSGKPGERIAHRPRRQLTEANDPRPSGVASTEYCWAHACKPLLELLPPAAAAGADCPCPFGADCSTALVGILLRRSNLRGRHKRLASLLPHSPPLRSLRFMSWWHAAELKHAPGWLETIPADFVLQYNRYRHQSGVCTRNAQEGF